jgi:hypothetical protein
MIVRVLLAATVVMAASLLWAPAVRAHEAGVIEGTVTNGTAGAPPPSGTEVVVHVLKNRVKTGERRVQTDAEGQFRADGLAADPDLLYFPIVTYGGVSYYPDRPVVLDGPTPATTAITVFEGTTSADAISFDRLNMLVVGVTPSALSIMEMGGVTNASDRTFAADAQVTGSDRTLRFLLPPGAMNVTPQAGLPADSLESMPDGFASTDPVRPGRREIAFSYDLPYSTATVDLERSFAFPVTSFTLYVPTDLGAVVPDGIAVPGLADLGGRQYRQFVVQQVSPDSTVRLRLTGLPAPLFATPRDLGLAVSGLTGAILLIFLAIGLRRRIDAPHDQPPASHQAAVALSAAAPGDDADYLEGVRAIAVLDERFEAGAMDEDEYRARRAAMKAQLIARTRQTVPAS